MQTPNTYRAGPDAQGHFGLYGGRFVAETLMPLILAVEAAYNAASSTIISITMSAGRAPYISRSG